ncbi:hypothetical protein OC834_007205 [Tilletia horrida]|nr:hypothetical protein OC834_007205 [Tilletia horrida]
MAMRSSLLPWTTSASDRRAAAAAAAAATREPEQEKPRADADDDDDETTALLREKKYTMAAASSPTSSSTSTSYSLLPTTQPIPRRTAGRWTRRLILIAICFTGPWLMLTFLAHYYNKPYPFGRPSPSSRSKTHPSPSSSLLLHTEGVGHFSEWSIAQKTRFLADLKKDSANAANWILVMGNEGGDLDSMASALLWAYHLTHNGTTSTPEGPTHGGEPRRAIQAVALLQTPEDALDLRPENKLALANAKMSPGHSDLLTIDELPLPPKELARKLHGLALVDHPRPRSLWAEGRIVSLFDHHTDRGDAPDAFPRIIESTASCSSLVAKYMLAERDKMKEPYHVSHELLELALSAIALDSDGLTASITTHIDYSTASKLFDLAPGYHEPARPQSLTHIMKSLSKTLKTAKKDLGALSVRDLLRRDWKGDVVPTTAEEMPNIHLGFASIPYSLRDMIDHRTQSHAVAEWFDIESGWTEEIRADVSVALTSFKINVPKQKLSQNQKRKHHKASKKGGHDDDDDDDDDDEWERVKRREIILVVRSDHRINDEQADNLFDHIVRAVESDTSLEVRRWDEAGDKDKLERRQMVWTHNRAEGGRKIVRPIIENAVKSWKM